MTNLPKRMETIGGGIYIESELGKGTLSNWPCLSELFRTDLNVNINIISLSNDKIALADDHNLFVG